MTPISAVVITLDEEERLPAALESVAFCDEVLVVDAGSRDRTREVAEARGARVLVNAPWPGWVEQRRLAVAAARHDWVLALDADERVTPALRAELETLRAQELSGAGYRMPRVAFYLGCWVRATDWYPDLQLRLFDRRQARWEGELVHESVAASGPVGRLRGEIEHHPYRDVADHLRKIDRYTTLWAEQARQAGRPARLLDLVFAPPWAFFRNYVLKRGFLLGRAGFTISGLNAYYTFAKLAKLAERGAAPRPA